MLSVENAKQKIEIQELEDRVEFLEGELEQLAEQADAKVKLLEAEIKALKDCDDKNGLTR